MAQTVGPGPVAAPVVMNTAGGSRTVVGNTQVTSATTGSGTNVTAGTLTFDPNAAGFPGGPISVLSVNGHALFVNTAVTPAAIVTRPGVSVSTTAFGSGAVALGAAASIDANGLTVSNTTTGTGGGYGVIAQDGGRITLTGSSVTTARTSSIALGSSGRNSSLTLQGTNTITTIGARSTGLYAGNGGTFVLPAGTVLNLTGQGSTGVVLDAAPQADTAIGTGLTIHLTGTGATNSNGGTGVALFSGSTATFRGLVIDGADAGTGVVVVAGDPRPLSTGFTGTRSHAVISDATITVSRSGGSVYSTTSTATAALVTAAGNTTPAMGGTTTAAPVGLRATPGSNSTALATSTIDATNTTINMNAANGYGVYTGARVVSGLNTVNLTNSTVNGSGSGSYGLGADQNGLVTATGSTLNMSGGGGALYLITGTDVAGGRGPTIQLTSTQATTRGDTAGIVSQNFSNTLTNQVVLTGSSISAPESVGIYAAGGPNTITVNNGAITGGDLLLQAVGSSSAPQATVVTLSALDHSVLNGDAYASATATANIALQTASRWNGASLNATNVSVDPSSTWSVTGNSAVTQQVSNAGTVAFTVPTAGAFKTLTTRNYVGSGGVLGVNTFLGTDGSASDKLIVNGGTASGTSGIRVANAGGAGAVTEQNGILVVGRRQRRHHRRHRLYAEWARGGRRL